MKTVAILTLLAAGCGSVDAVRVPDGGDVVVSHPDVGADVAVSGGACSIDAGYTTFFDAVIDGDCWASYTVSRGTNTFNCTCTSPAVCSQASIKLTAEGQACIQRMADHPVRDAAGDSPKPDADPPKPDASSCIPSTCTACVDGGAVSIPNCGVG